MELGLVDGWPARLATLAALAHDRRERALLRVAQQRLTTAAKPV